MFFCPSEARKKMGETFGELSDSTSSFEDFVLISQGTFVQID